MAEILETIGFLIIIFCIAFIEWLFMDWLHGYDIRKEPFWKRWWGWGVKKKEN